jgi:hypothetical protein
MQQFPHISIQAGNPEFPHERTLQRYLNEWGFNLKYKKLAKEYNTEALTNEVWILFYDWALTDKEMLYFLQKRGYNLEKRRYILHILFNRVIVCC